MIVRSVFSHLAAADVPQEDDFTRGQISAFGRMADALSGRIGYRPMRHVANSAALERFQESKFDMCRLGIGLYGISALDKNPLRPVSRLTTRIVQVKELDDSQTVGYGRAGKLSRQTLLATIPVGYADGLDRHLGQGAWAVEIAGKKAPVVGRICMDSCMVDVTGLDAAEGDEVIGFGGGEGHSLEAMARLLGTLPYAVMTSVSERVKRIYLIG